MNTETITTKIYAESDAKLREFAKSRLGDLFDLCGGHAAEHISQESNSQLQKAARQCGISPNSKIWHGSVWHFAEQILFEMLKDKWRNNAVTDFLAKIERLSTELEQVRDIAESYEH